jgi:ER membrane protein complex subunit 1
MTFFRRQKYIGKIRFSQFDQLTADKAIVATEENVLAALSSKTGEILWRRIFETDNSRGDIKFLHVSREQRNVVNRNGDADPFGVITVSGHNPALVRGWDVNTGNLAWEWPLIAIGDNSNGKYFYKDSYIHHVMPVWGSHIEVTEYHASTGQPKTSKSSRISAGWISEKNCVFTLNYFTCLVKEQLLILDILANENNVKTKAIQGSTISIAGEGFVKAGKQIISLENLQVVMESDSNVFVDERIYQLTQNGKEIKITSENQELLKITDIPETLDNNLKIIASKCKPKKDAPSQLICRFLLSTCDGAVTLAHQDKFRWIREEALTQISAVEFLDLSLSDAQGAIEEELNNKDGE